MTKYKIVLLTFILLCIFSAHAFFIWQTKPNKPNLTKEKISIKIKQENLALPALMAKTKYNWLERQNLFHPRRFPAYKPPSPNLLPPTLLWDSYDLIGVSSSGDEGFAIFRPKNGRKNLLLKIGSRFGGWVLRHVATNSVILENGGIKIEKYLRN